MSEKIHFKYENIGNMIRILVSLIFESKYDKRDITTYHARFDDESDDYFENIVKKLYPNGCTIGETELQNMTEYLFNLMQRDEKCKDLYAKWDKSHMYSWVYFKPDKTVEYAVVGDHARIVKDKCLEYFRKCENIDARYLQKFILENFEIRSDCSTIEQISKDAPYIAEQININNCFS